MRWDDDAGKGPELGSMFAAAVRADPAALPGGVGDSMDHQAGATRVDGQGNPRIGRRRRYC